MKKNIKKSVDKHQLKAVIKQSFDDMLSEVVKGKMSIQDFTDRVSYNYTQKKMELSGSIF